MIQHSEKPVFFLKKAQPTGFLCFIGFWALLHFSDFSERTVWKHVGWFS